MPTLRTLITGCCLLAALLNNAAARAADWPPTLDAKNVTTRSLDGRVIERYVHGPRAVWGYPASASAEWGYPAAQETGPNEQNHNSFYLVAPKRPRAQAPLCVVLHSANRTAFDYLGYQCLNRKTLNNGKVVGSDDPATAMTNSPDDFYALFLSSTNAEWWGWGLARASANYAKHINAPSPGELRVLDTIEWVAARSNIDRNRIYLCGVSMGGCGTLGIGMPNGNVFAAVRADVPAGTAYASYRMGGFAPSPAVDASPAERDAWIRRASAVGLPDPPVVVDFSSQSDGWATTQPALLQAAQVGRLPLVVSWGMFGHTTFSSLIAKYPICEVALAYPWLEIRKNEAYPVFTRASSDQRAPWLNAPAEFDAAGQINAYFRWKNQADTPSQFAMQLWLAQPAVANPPWMPKDSTADITLRRLQRFKIRPGAVCAWRLVRGGKLVGSGKIAPDATRLLTIPRVTVTTVAAELSLTSVPAGDGSGARGDAASGGTTEKLLERDLQRGGK
jgi:poly(3-hydroxybutyrate) depolymerase